MEWYEIVIKAAAVAGAIGVLYKPVKTVWKFFKGLQENILETNKVIKDVKERCDENELNMLRLTIISKDMPMSERLIAGEKYIERGGNGEVKHLYADLYEKVNGKKLHL